VDALNDSYYRATAHDFPSMPPLMGEAQADVCVVGGGFTGLAAALKAAENGYSVILLEGDRIGHGASGRNGGQLIPGLRWDSRELVSAFGKGVGYDLFQLAIGARAMVHSRIEKHDIACDLKSGHLHVAYKPKHYDDMRREIAHLEQEMDYHSATLVDATSVPTLLGSDRYHGGVYDRAGGHFHPLNYALGLAKAARRLGVTLHDDSRVIALDDGPQGAVVKTTQGSVRAKYVLLGSDGGMGGFDPAIGRFTMPIMNYNVATVPLDPDRADALIPSNAAVSDSRFVLNYFRLSADHRLIFGGGEKYTPTPPPDIGAFVLRHITEVFPHMAKAAIEYRWGGAVNVTMNRLPQFGRKGNVFYAHGYSGHGALVATLGGELMAEAMAGTAERFDLFAKLPHRPFPGGKVLRHPLYVAGMLWYALRDRL
jgi:gamma-glutamylputrescine oxidase